MVDEEDRDFVDDRGFKNLIKEKRSIEKLILVGKQHWEPSKWCGSRGPRSREKGGRSYWV